MTVDDLKAVLMSWGIEIPKKPSKEMLQTLVAKEYKQIMKRLYGHLRHATSTASSSCASYDKAVGTDLPALVMSFIGSEGGLDIVENSIKLIVNEPSEFSEYEVDDAGNTLGRKKEIGDDRRGMKWSTSRARRALEKTRQLTSCQVCAELWIWRSRPLRRRRQR